MKKLLIVVVFLILMLFVFVVIRKRQFDIKLKKQISIMLLDDHQNKNNLKSNKITLKDLENLPDIVQKWLISVGVVGKNQIQYTILSQKGRMKLKPDQKDRFYPKAKQYINLNKPGYLWHVNIPMFPFMSTKGKDMFYEGRGSMEILIGYLLFVVKVNDNKKINESSLHRFLLELPWYPTGALQDYISWEEVDSHTAKAIMTYGGYNVKVLFYFDKDGSLLKQKALRYKKSDDKAKRLPCVGEVKGTTIVDGIKVPNQYDVSWYIDGNKFTWYELENYDIDFIY